MGRLLIIGTGGQGKVVLDCALEAKAYTDIAFVTNDLSAKTIAGYPVYHEQEIATSSDNEHALLTFYKGYDEVLVAIGNNQARLAKSLQLIQAGVQLATIIHPKAVVSRFAQIGQGTVVFAQAVLNPFAVTGTACIINTGAIIEHDCRIGNGVHVSPAATLAGSVTVGDKSWICVGSSITNNISIGANTIIGAGAVVLNDVDSNVVAAGVPAKVIKRNA